ncbi:chaperone J-domain-containing protein [Ceratobasidium sp. AG-I]|nr:chaperone J-domain-containing protein [Ceratobasidium sp. AG-I]
MDWLNQLGPYQGFVTRTVAWWFIPGLATRTVLTLYYSLLSGFGLGHRIPAGDSPKRPNHYRRAFALVVLSYLAWTLVNDLQEQPPSFYSLLGVDTGATDVEIKAAYKMFARRNHPDRVGPAGAPLFIQVRDAYEALKHPIKRYGYDRFGFDALEWKVAENPHAMLYQGLEHAMHYYVPTGLVMLVLAVVGRGGTSAYWRYVTWALVATLEACLIIGFNPLSSYSNPLSALLNRVAHYAPAATNISMMPSMAPYQWVFFLRQLFISVALALGQVVPVLFPPPPTQNEVRAREAEITRLAIALDPVVRQIIVQSAISDKHGTLTLRKILTHPDICDYSTRNVVQRSSIPRLSTRPPPLRA